MGRRYKLIFNRPTVYIVVKPWITLINSLAFISSYYVSSNDVIYHKGYGEYKYIVFRVAFDIKTGVRVVAWLSGNAL